MSKEHLGTQFAHGYAKPYRGDVQRYKAQTHTPDLVTRKAGLPGGHLIFAPGTQTVYSPPRAVPLPSMSRDWSHSEELGTSVQGDEDPEVVRSTKWARAEGVRLPPTKYKVTH